MTGFDAFAVSSKTGPHVTMQASVVHLGRHWTTTTRGSVKTGAVRRVGTASATRAEGDGWHLVGGRAAILDPMRPWTFADSPLAGALAGGAILRLLLSQLDQFIGYAETGRGVPTSFLPAGRVLLVASLDDELVLDGDDVVRAMGRWAEDQAPVTADDRAGSPSAPDGRILARVPGEIAALAKVSGPAWLGVETATGAVALPAIWDASDGTVRASRAALTALVAELPGPVCVTLDESGGRRPDEKLGLMLRGRGAVVAVSDRVATVSIEVGRATCWDGFRSSTFG